MPILITFRADCALAVCVALVAGAALAVAQDASAIGKVAEIPIPSRLSSSAGAPPDRLAMGSPAMIVDVKDVDGKRWFRLFAVDGTHGWTAAAPARIGAAAIQGSVEGFVRDPDADSPDGGTIQLDAPVVTGASEKPGELSPALLLYPPESNWLLSPMLRVQAAANPQTIAWVWPFEVHVASPLAPKGLVRALFGREKPVAVPPARQLIPRVDAEGDAVKTAKTGYMEEWTAQSVEFIGDAGASLAVLPGKESHLLRITRAGVHRFLIFDKYAPSLRAVAHEDWSGDRVKEWLVEVIQLTGDGHRVVLWVIEDRFGPQLRATPIELGASSGENGERLTGEVVRDRKRSRLWVVQSDTESTTVKQVRFLPGKAVAMKVPAVLVMGELRDTRQLAMADALAKGLDVFPVAAGGVTKWTAGAVVRNQAEAAVVQRGLTGLRVVVVR